MTDREALGLYFAAFRTMKRDMYGADELSGIVDEMRRVVSARDLAEAAGVIEWWGCWDERSTARKAAQRVRRMWRRRAA